MLDWKITPDRKAAPAPATTIPSDLASPIPLTHSARVSGFSSAIRSTCFENFLAATHSQVCLVIFHQVKFLCSFLSSSSIALDNFPIKNESFYLCITDLRRDRYQTAFFGFPSPAFAGLGFGLSPFSAFHQADHMLDNGFSAFTASTTNFESNFDTPQAIRRITTTTKIVNGKKISTKKYVPEYEMDVSFFLNQSINQSTQSITKNIQFFSINQSINREDYTELFMFWPKSINQLINHWIILARYLIYSRKLIDIERWLVCI